MSKNVQIDEQLFFDTYAYLCEHQDDVIARDLTDKYTEKLDRIIDREIFSLYKRASTQAEREAYRQRYLDRKGISNSFRTEKETPYHNL